MFGNGILSMPRRPESAAAIRLKCRLLTSATPQPAFPQDALAKRFARSQKLRHEASRPGHSDADCASDAKPDRKQKLGDVMGVIAHLLACQEMRAAVALLEHLASSSLAEADISCTESMFKNQMVEFLNRHTSDLSKKVVASIRRRISEEAEEQETSRTPTKASRTPTAPPPRTPGGTSSFLDNSLFRYCRQSRSVSMNTTRTASRSTHESFENRGARGSEYGFDESTKSSLAGGRSTAERRSHGSNEDGGRGTCGRNRRELVGHDKGSGPRAGTRDSSCQNFDDVGHAGASTRNTPRQDLDDDDWGWEDGPREKARPAAPRRRPDSRGAPARCAARHRRVQFAYMEEGAAPQQDGSHPREGAGEAPAVTFDSLRQERVDESFPEQELHKETSEGLRDDGLGIGSLQLQHT